MAVHHFFNLANQAIERKAGGEFCGAVHGHAFVVSESKHDHD